MREQQENHSFSWFWGQIRLTLFEIIAGTLEHNLVNTFLYLVVLIYELLQYLPFMLTIGFQVYSGNPDAYSIFQSVIDVLSQISLNSSCLNPSFSFELIFSIGFLLLFMVAFGLLVYMTFFSTGPRNHYENSSFILKSLSVFFIFLSMIAPIPIFIIEFSVFNCVNLNGVSVFASDGTTQCWGSLHYSLIVISCLDTLFYLIALTIIDSLFNENSPRSLIPWACSSANQYKILGHCFKIVLVCFAIYDPLASNFHVFYPVEIVITGFIEYIILVSPPFINKICGIVVLFINSIVLFLLIEMYILRFLNYSILQDGSVMLSATVVFLSMIILLAQDKFIDYVVSIQVSASKNESTKETYFYELFRILNNYNGDDSYYTIKMAGIYSNHQILCTAAGCKCGEYPMNMGLQEMKKRAGGDIEGMQNRRIQNENFETQTSKLHGGYSSLFRVVSQATIDSTGRAESFKDASMVELAHSGKTNCSLYVIMCTSLIDSEVQFNIGSLILRLISAYFYREYIGNIFKSVYDLMYIAENMKPSFRYSFLLFRYKMQINEEIAGYTKRKTRAAELDVETLIAFEKHYATFRDLTESASYLVNQFWNMLKNKEIDVNGLYDIGSKVSVSYEDIHKHYDAALDIFPHSYKLVVELGNFEKYIMNNEEMAQNFETQAKQIYKEHNHGDTKNIVFGIDLSSRACICVASGNTPKIGDIISVNDEIFYSLGYKAKEVIEQNLAAVCPPYIAHKHNAMIEDFIKRGSSNFLGAHRLINGCNIKGFLVPLEVAVIITPNVSEGIRFVAIFKKLEIFRDYFRNSTYPCSESDFAIIVASVDGIILGINELCMTKMGIPISLFRKKGGEGILISALIRAVSEPDTEQELLGDGKRVEIDTTVLQYTINRENITQEETKCLDQNAGKFNVFLKLTKESYSNDMVVVNCYRMLLITGSSDHLESPVAEEMEQGPITIGLNTKEKLDAEEEKTELAGSDTTGPVSVVKGLNDLKQKMNTKGASFSVGTIKMWVNLLILVIIALASTQFGFLLSDSSTCDNQAEILHEANKRLTKIALLHSQVFTNVNMSLNSSQPLVISNINIYEYLRECGYRCIGVLSSSENYLNTIDFGYSDLLTSLEKKATVQMETLGMNLQVTLIAHTINTAITQYTSQASDFMSYSFTDLRNLISNSSANSAIATEYFFVNENGIKSLSIAANQSEKEFRSLMKSRTGNMLVYYICNTALIGVALLVCYGSIVPKLVKIKREKIDVLLLYTQMTKKEINAVILKCIEYEKMAGFWVEEESSGVGGDSPKEHITPNSGGSSEYDKSKQPPKEIITLKPDIKESFVIEKSEVKFNKILIE